MHSIVSPSTTRAIDWARHIAADPRSLYLDTETTGLGSDAEIVDIAVVDSSGRVLLDALVRPAHPIPAESTRIHGITDAMVATAPRWDQIAPRLRSTFSEASSVVIYNADFDIRIMEQCNARFQFFPYRANWQCAMKQYAAFAGEPHQRYGGYRWHKLSDAAARFGFHEPVEHRALADARLCRAVVTGMAGS